MGMERRMLPIQPVIAVCVPVQMLIMIRRPNVQLVYPVVLVQAAN